MLLQLSGNVASQPKLIKVYDSKKIQLPCCSCLSCAPISVQGALQTLANMRTSVTSSSICSMSRLGDATASCCREYY